ncbi:unnamed protein product [Paramecium primaurelia]|uniref:Uncharacterized protein n=1 Tax=Paramecium primaurelia TaxID=5886 RepID=A0A8S1KZB2_PARPR|nr:unnamed protein product [Paramecium primaurelia]
MGYFEQRLLLEQTQINVNTLKILYLNITVVAYMIKEMMGMKMGDRLSQAIDLEWILKSLLMVNIKMVRKLGTFIGKIVKYLNNVRQKYQILSLNLKVEVDGMMMEEMKSKLINGLSLVKSLKMNLVTSNGEYRDGKKLCNWDFCIVETKYKIILINIYFYIFRGVGLYDERGYGYKIGIWIELSEGVQ